MSSAEAYTADYRVIPAQGVKSLVWMAGKLVDWVSGVVEYDLEGARRGPSISYSYRFDAAVVSPSGSHVALYERLGTKAIVLGANRFPVREINRSFYHAHVYEYPILFVRLPDGREALAHCPDEYCELAIEDPATGDRWSTPGSGRLRSTFHSRLATNHNGDRILSAGWVWHPFDTVRVFDLKPNDDGRIPLDLCDECCNQGAEVSSAIFGPSGTLITASSREADDFSEEPGERRRPGTIAVYDLDEQRSISLASLEDEAGTLMLVGANHVVGFFDHPKLIEIATGRVLHRWPELKTGQQNSSILWHIPLPPPLALDSPGGRFAVADEKQITIVTLDPHLSGRDRAPRAVL
jgi:hypothetical protein